MSKLTPNASYSRLLRLSMPDDAALLTTVVDRIGAGGGSLVELRELARSRGRVERELVFDAPGTEQAAGIVTAITGLAGVRLDFDQDRTFLIHEGGKISVESRYPLRNQADLSMAYTPGVARVCKAIEADPELGFRYTCRKNMVAVVTDGTAVLGLGDIGPTAGLPVMEGKAVLFKTFGGVDAFPICLDTKDTEEIISAVKWLAPGLGGINLEDISAPRCFEIEKRLVEELDIPVFHDDQHGTAIVSLAALYNALKIVKKKMENLRVVINGAGAAGITCARLLRRAGVPDITLCDSKGILSRDRTDLNEAKREFAVAEQGGLAEACRGRDLFLGVSVPGVLTPEMVRSMAAAPVVFAMANPVPEVQPELVREIAAVIATGRSDYPNQINNVLAFPGIFRGALDCRARRITVGMHLAAARAIAALVGDDELAPAWIIPSVFDPRVAPAVAEAVKAAARSEGVARE